MSVEDKSTISRLVYGGKKARTNQETSKPTTAFIGKVSEGQIQVQYMLQENLENYFYKKGGWRPEESCLVPYMGQESSINPRTSEKYTTIL